MKTFISSSKDVCCVFDIHELITLRKIVAYGVSSISDEIDRQLPDDPLLCISSCEGYRNLRDFLNSSTDDLVNNYLGL